jgi:hypothetical protein
VSWHTFIAFVAAIGVGTIISAFIGHLVSVSNHRQAWIDALRDDIAGFFKAVEAMRYAFIDYMQDSAKYEDKKRQTRIDLLFIYQRIRLRLNRTEDLHQELDKKLSEFLNSPLLQFLEDGTKVADAMDVSRRILKLEWEVVKYPWKPYYAGIRKILFGR